MKHGHLALAGLVVAWGVGCASNPPPVTKMIGGQVVLMRGVSARAYEHAARAMLFEEDSRWDDAAAEYRLALAEDEKAPELHARLAEVLLRADRVDEAAQAIAQSLALAATTEGLLAQAHWAERTAHAAAAVTALESARALTSFRADVEDAEQVALELADAYLYALNIEGAAKSLGDLCSALPTSVNGRMRAAAVAWARGDTGEAEARLKETLAIEPGTVEAITQLAWLYAASGRNDAARETFTTAIERSEGALDVATAYARWLVGVGLVEEARTLADDLAGPDTDDNVAAERMELERVVKRPERALALADRVLKDDQGPAAHARLALAKGMLLVDMDRPEAATAAFLSITGENELAFDAHLRAAAVARDAGQITRAYALLDDAVSLEHPADKSANLDTANLATLTVARAEVDEKAGKPAIGAQRLREFLKQAGRGADRDRVVLTLAALEDRAGHWQAALALAEDLVSHDVGNVEALNFAGFIAADHDQDLPRAQKRLQTALAFEPGSAAILDSVGWVRFRAGDVPGAALFLEQAARLLPDDPEVLGHSAALFAKQGDTTRAATTLTRALTLKPDDPVRKRLEDQLRELGGRRGDQRTAPTQRAPHP